VGKHLIVYNSRQEFYWKKVEDKKRQKIEAKKKKGME